MKIFKLLVCLVLRRHERNKIEIENCTIEDVITINAHNSVTRGDKCCYCDCSIDRRLWVNIRGCTLLREIAIEQIEEK